MPTYDSVELSTDVIWANDGVTGGPTFHTDVCHSADGSEQRNSSSRHARRVFDINTGVIDDDLRELLFDFYEARRAQSDSFTMIDPFDYTATSEPIVSGQLVKRYTCGSVSYDRPITKPKSGTVSFSGGGTLDYETGIISGGAGGTWSGQFKVQCRFASDHYSEANFFSDWHEASVQIIEVPDSPDYPILTRADLASTITYTFPCSFEIGRRREQQWSTYVHQGGGYSEHRTTQYSARKAAYSGNVIIPTYTNLQQLIALFLVARGRRTAFQYETLDVRFGRDDLRIRTVGTGAYEADVSLVEV